MTDLYDPSDDDPRRGPRMLGLALLWAVLVYGGGGLLWLCCL